MRKVIATVATVSIAVLAVVSPASAFEGGGRKPSEAPLITVGQHYNGELNNHKSDANYNGELEVALWRLPPLTTRDVFTVSWHVVPFVHSNGFPVCMVFVQDANDYNWGTDFREALINGDGECYEGGPLYSVSGSGTAQTTITANQTDPNASYLEFFAQAEQETSSGFEPYPYDFTVEPILHYLSVAPKPVQRVSANGVFRATANLASGSPAPDGLTFDLSVTWADGGVASYTGISSGGVVSFQLALPETAYGKTATFVVSHPADGTYQAVTGEKLQVKVAKPKALPPSPCVKAQRHAHVLARQLKRLKRHARFARGRTRRRLHRRARHLGREFRVARKHAASACGTG
jgi:hypothetical protein